MSEKLKKISEYKAEMLHQISHEIRSPLQTLLWTHNYLMSKHPGSLNEKQLEMLDAMGVTIERLTKFSNQFLDLTKTEAGMMQYNLERTDVIALVVNIVKEMEFGALNKKITISLDTQSAPEVMVDAEKMSVVIGNLISNAIKYTKENGNIRVSAGASGRNIRISVTDSGIGIPEKELAHIFKKFYRASNAAASGGAGAGVGLALVKAFTEGLGGKISVTSTTGSGSTFTIKLPINSGNSKAVQPGLKEKQNL
jgi:two-component system, NtrC family, sensor histidine kinase GlrK